MRRGPGATQLWLLNLDGSGLREVLRVNDHTDLRADWLDEDRIGFVCDRDGADWLGVLTLSTGAVDWLAGEPDLCPHDVLPGAGHFACIAHRALLERGGDLRAAGPARSAEPVGAPQPAAA